MIRNKINQNLKRLIITFVIIFTLQNVVFANSNDFQALQINLVNQNPDPVYSGDIFEIILSLENIGYGVIEDRIINIKENYPFTLISENNLKIKNILSSDYAQTIKFKLKVDSEVKSGIYLLTIIERANSLTTIREHQIQISVGSNNNIEIININKNKIAPGDYENVTFTLKNIGNSVLRDIYFSWESENNILLPVNSDNLKYINNLNINEEKNITFLISSSSIATPNLYLINLKLNYNNENNNDNSIQTSKAGIYVGGETDFDIIYNQNTFNEYVFSILNTGPNDASSIKVSIDEKSEWRAGIKNSELIGNLNIGDYSSFSFDFHKNIGKLIFNIEYTDTSGKRNSIIKTLNLNQNVNLEIDNQIQTSIPGSRGGKSGQVNPEISTNIQTSQNPISSLTNVGIKLKENILYYLIYITIGTIILIYGIRFIKKKLRIKNNKNEIY